jgi:predicted NUDIX family NTP pyrophosphohydrolase
MAVKAAGLLMYRKGAGGPEVLLVHQGGPYWAKKDLAGWSLPKGEAKEGEELIDVAKREFEEETGVKPEGEFIFLNVSKRPGKEVHVWYFEGDCDASKVRGNMIEIEWPPRSGKKIEIPEVDKGEFFTLDVAKTKIFTYLKPSVEAFEKLVIEKKI